MDTFLVFEMVYSWLFCLCAANIPEARKCTFLGLDGWKCDDQSCIPQEWICDNYYQCLTDDSDEEDGCNLYPDTACKSWGGNKYVKCPDNPECVIFQNPVQVESDCRKGRVDGNPD